MKHGKLKVAVAIVSIVSIVGGMLAVANTGEEDILLLDALINGRNYLGYDDTHKKNGSTEVPPLSALPDGITLEHGMAMQIDLTQLPSKEVAVGSDKSNLYTGNAPFNLKHEIEQYTLLCEILSRDEINPKDEDIKITPAMVYGSWSFESGMATVLDEDVSIYDGLTDRHRGTGSYVGPLQMSESFLDGIISDTGGYSNRMFTYISKYENKTLADDKRTLRALSSELGAITNEKMPNVSSKQAITNGLRGDLNVCGNDILGYSKDFTPCIKTPAEWAPAIRPNPLYLPDVLYTFCRKLRYTYDKQNVYTLNTDYVETIDRIEDAFDTVSGLNKNIDASGKTLSELYYMYALSLNSSDLPQHQYSEDLFGPYSVNPQGTMPTVYMEILAQYGSFEPKALGLSSYNDARNNWARILYGKTVDEIGNRQGNVKEPNLIDRLEKNKKVMTYEVLTIRDTIEHSMIDLSWETRQTLFYPLRCLSAGKYIQQGVEEMIRNTHAWQLKQGIISDVDTGIGDNTGVGMTPDAAGIYGDTGVIKNIDLVSEGISQTRVGWRYCRNNTVDCTTIYPDNLLGKLTGYGTVYPMCIPEGELAIVSHGYWCYNPMNLNECWCGCPMFHNRRGHRATDLIAGGNNRSQEIVSFYDGIVLEVLNNKPIYNDGSYGNYALIEHTLRDGTKFRTRYGHMATESVVVKVGELVVAGQKIGIEGTTGGSTGNHLHFELMDIDNKRHYDFEAIMGHSRILNEAIQKKGVETPTDQKN